MFPYPILSDNSEAQHSSISIYIPSAGRSFMLEFRYWLFKDIWFGAFQIAFGILVICCSYFFFQERSLFFLILREDRIKPEDHGSWFRFAGCCWYHEGFFQTTAGVRSDRGRFIFELFGFFWLSRQILFTSVPLYYFDLKSDWLPFIPIAFGSPPEDLLFWYLLFVTIR